jgi:hypothetical protein
VATDSGAGAPNATLAGEHLRPYVRSPFVLKKQVYERARSDNSGFLPVSCWCERNIVAVTECDVRDGQTASCGHPTCHVQQKAPRR